MRDGYILTNHNTHISPIPRPSKSKVSPEVVWCVSGQVARGHLNLKAIPHDMDIG